MKDLFILEPFEGEQQAQVIFASKDILLRYMDHIFNQQDGHYILEGYNIVFSMLFEEIDANETIENISIDSSCVPALSWYRANRICYRCEDCDRESLESNMVKAYNEIDGKEYFICPDCHSENLKKLF